MVMPGDARLSVTWNAEVEGFQDALSSGLGFRHAGSHAPSPN
jgi:hypothetical protein